ncbi:voltage-gated potassium channel [Pseudomonas frederiksbergensis]
MDSNKNWREDLYVIIFQSDTPAGRRFDSILLLIILASLVIVILDSIDSVHQNYADILAYIEWGFTIVFAIEYGLRLYCSPKPLRYAFSFYGLVDLLAIVPGILALYYSDAQYLLIIRIIRMLRIFRVLKLSPYLKQANYLMTALRGSKQKIVVFLLSVSTLVTVFGTLMYVIEGPEHGFTSIPKGIYWAIVTLTTVGFGDIRAQDAIGSGGFVARDDHRLLYHRRAHRDLYRGIGQRHARRTIATRLPDLPKKQPRTRRRILLPLRQCAVQETGISKVLFNL